MNFNISIRDFQKNEYFIRYEDFADIFGGHHKIGLVLGVILCIIGSFLIKVNVHNVIFFWVAKISNIFVGCLIFLIFFGDINSRCLVQAYI